ncbi:CinA family protein [Methylomonas paludis]|uniref:CinA family protein n=1 Tax=Methylomonas paludis TaxID=1173101 RepID=A0A975R7W1_9GAMM|nr:CinA family protein [Methylomonas paludis]QWF69680.1 CinA family protein [Methylomonas paludis]
MPEQNTLFDMKLLTLVRQLKAQLIDNSLTIAVAESLSCGHLQAALGAVSGSSAYFAGGVTAYNFQQKIVLLDIEPFHAATVNCVSQQVANEMALGACRLFNVDLAIGTTGYAEPSPDNQVETPFAYFGICHREADKIHIVAEQHLIGNGLDRIAMQTYVASAALQALLVYLQQLNSSG